MLTIGDAIALAAVLGTITAAIIKIVPQRAVVRTSDGHRCATYEQAVDILSEAKEANRRAEGIELACKLIAHSKGIHLE